MDVGKPPVPIWLNTVAAYAWRLLVVGAAIYVVGRILDVLFVLALPFAAALFISSILMPPANWLRSKRVPSLLATWIVVLGFVGVFVLIIKLLYPNAHDEFAKLGPQLNRGISDIRDWLHKGPLNLSSAELDGYVKAITEKLSTYQTTALQGAVTGITAVAEAFAAILMTTVLTFFFVKDGKKISEWFFDLFGGDRRNEFEEVGARAWQTLGGYVRGTTVNGTVNAAVLTSGMLILHVPLVLPIAILTFIGGYLPLAGAFISGGIAAIVTLVAKGPLEALLIVILTVLVHNLEGYIVGPFVLGRAVHLHPVAILCALTTGTIIGGVLGAFVAVPVTAIAGEVVAHYRAKNSATLSDVDEPT